jgi:hypothetical protein
VTASRRTKGKLERFIVRFITGAMLLPLNAWYLMLAAGIAHRDWWPQVPVIGYGDSVILTFLVSAAIGSMVAQATDRSA